MLGPATTLIGVNHNSIVAARPQVITMTTSYSFQYKETNGVITSRHLPNIFTTELGSSFFMTTKIGYIEGI